MATKKPTHVVVHRKLYLAVGGKLQHVKEGSQVYLDSKTAEKLGAKVSPISSGKTVDVGSNDDDS